MSETLTLAADASLDALAASAWELEPVPPHERKGVLRDEAALLLDRLLVRVARGRGALEVALGEGLAALSVGDRVLRLGFSCLGDYSRERLGIAGSTAEKLARLARNLRERPLLREAVWRGEVSARKAETIVPVTRGEDEARWVALARVETVRALAAAVKTAGAIEPESDEPWERVLLPCPPEPRAKLDEAMALAGKLLGASSPKWQRLEAICEEYLGAHPADTDSDGSVDPCDDPSSAMLDRLPSGDALEATKAWLEEETRRWSFLDAFEPVAAPVEMLGCGPLVDLARLDGDLRRLCALRSRWDELFGHLALLLRQLGLWHDMQFGSFGHYCAERTTVQKRVLARDRGCCQVPGCSRAAVQVHHVTFRSHGGGDEPSNLVGLCAAHHLHAVHVGWVRVTGKAPQRLRWSFRAGGGPAVNGEARA